MEPSSVPVHDLPKEVHQLIADVVRRTGLWSREKKDVRAELESHFREGMEELCREGVPGDRAVGVLRERFGEPRVAARLIRRGKKRNRPVIWKTFVIACRGFMLTLVLIALYIGWIFNGRPTPSVDYVAKLNAPVDKVPESERAWPVLRQVDLDFHPMPGDLSNVWNHGALELTREQWPAMVAWVQSNHHLIPEIQRAAHRTACGYRYDNGDAQRFTFERNKRRADSDTLTSTASFTEVQEDPLTPRMISILLPHVSAYRELARLLVCDARVRAASGDFDGACGSLDSAQRLGFQLVPLGTIIEQLVGVGCINLASAELRSLAYERRAKLTPAQIHTLRSMAFMTASSKAIHTDLRGERYMFEDLVQYLFTDNGWGDGHLIPSQMAKVEFSPTPERNPLAEGAAIVHAGRKATLAKYREVWDEMERLRQLPLSDPRRAEAEEPMKKLVSDPVDGIRYQLIARMMPSLKRADQLMREAAMNQSATKAVVELLAYRVDHGRFPDRLALLVPGYLSKVPTDIYSDDELRYFLKVNGDCTLYSIGPNLEDDRGDPVIIEMVENRLGGEKPLKSGKHPADMVYWPSPLSSNPATRPASRPAGMARGM